MNRYYPRKWLVDKTGKEPEALSTASGWSYHIADGSGERLIVDTNYHHKITNVSFTPGYNSIGRSLKIAQTKGYRVCWYLGHTNGHSYDT